MRASRLLAPITASSHQDGSIGKHQHPKIKVSKVRKSNDNDSSQHKLALGPRRKSDDQGSFKHFLTPIGTLQSQLTVSNPFGNYSFNKKRSIGNDEFILFIVEKDKNLSSTFNRQISGKSSKKEVSRLETAKSFATGRCVTSPLSADGKNEQNKRTKFK